MRDMRAVIHLDNLEGWQQAGARAESRRVVVNSPRSLRACALCGIDPTTALEGVSLPQHLDLILTGACWVDRSTPEGEVNLQAALEACQGAGITGGTPQQRMQAYRNFTKHETTRRETLNLAQEVRRQLIAEEMFERRRRAHVDNMTLRATTESSATQPIDIKKGESVLDLKKRLVEAAPWPVTNNNNKKNNNNTVPVEKIDRITPKKEIDNKQDQSKEEEKEEKQKSPPPNNNFPITDKMSIDRTVSIKRISENSPQKLTTEKTPIIEDLVENRSTSSLTPATGEGRETQAAAAMMRIVRESNIQENAPPVPPISLREQEEVFYYYCANPVAVGSISEYREQSIL